MSEKNSGYDPIFKDARGKYVACLSTCEKTKYIGSFASKAKALAALKSKLDAAGVGKCGVTKKKRWVHYY